MDNEFRLFGPPGTGKTTTLKSWIDQDARKNGSESILVASFTRTAAHEIAGRHLPLAREQVGTLHSHCYRAIGKPDVTAKHIDDWNAFAPAWKLGSTARQHNMDEPETDQSFDTPAEAIYSQYQILRARMTPRSDWPLQVTRFAQKWEDWKAAHHLVDFTDMIEIAYRDVENPGYSIAYYDEAQDFNPLELALIRHWGESMDHYILAGDDDQCLYSWSGASADAFINPPLSPSQKRILTQSYRVPRSIQAYAQSWIEQLHHREPKLYRPRADDGLLMPFAYTHYDTERIVEAVEQHLGNGKTVMVLSTCSYMLKPLIDELRTCGIPFHNPYRRSRGDWNPLTPSTGISASERLLAFLAMDTTLYGEDAHVWTGLDLKKWADCLKADQVFRRGAKAQIEQLPFEQEVRFDWFAQWMHDEAFSHALDMDLDWFIDHALASKRGPLDFPYQIVKSRGAKALTETPKLTIGTIHSVKGGQADVVLLFPDISKAAMAEWQDHRSDGHDALIRAMYVGMTRARETLILGHPLSSLAVALPVLETSYAA